MARSKVTEREVRAARAFVNYLHGNAVNTYLLLAVIAWFRAMGKAHDPFWKSLQRGTAQYTGVALAKRLLTRARSDRHHYGPLLKVLRRSSKRDADLSEQAQSFIRGIEQSGWSKTQYDYVAYREGHFEHVWHQVSQSGSGYWEDVWVPEVQEQDPLWRAWAKLTDHPNIPNKWFVDTVTTTRTKVVPPRPHQPRSLLHVLPTVDYIQPYAAQQFYDAKPHYGDSVLVDPD